MTRQLIASFLGEDRPGVIHGVSQVMADIGCNILEMTQTILRCEFAAMIIVDPPAKLDAEGLKAELDSRLESLNLQVTTKALADEPAAAQKREPYVATLHGDDRKGLIARATAVFLKHGVNIEHLQAISRQSPAAGVVLVFEVQAPEGVDMAMFRRDLESACQEMGIQMSLQHRDIFEAIHRI